MKTTLQDIDILGDRPEFCVECFKKHKHLAQIKMIGYNPIELNETNISDNNNLSWQIIFGRKYEVSDDVVSITAILIDK